jgi:hypothetical protein
LEQLLIVNVPGIVLAIGFVVVSVTAGLGGLFIVRRNVALATLEQHNDVAGFIIAVVGVLYAVILGFVVVIVWQQFDNAQSNAHSEAVTVENLYNNAVAFGDQARPLQRDLLAYGSRVINQEWSVMRDHQHGDQPTDVLLDRVWTDLQGIRTTGPDQDAFYSQSITAINKLEEERNARLDDASRSLPFALWSVLIMGAIITVGFTYFFGVSHLAAHAMMVAALSAIIGIALFLAVSLDLPYSGDLGIKPTALQHTIAELRTHPLPTPGTR